MINPTKTQVSEKIEDPIVGAIYRHFKGGIYRVLAVGLHTENDEGLVAYQEVYHNKQFWFRPLEDHDKAWKTPQDNGEPRFTRVE